MRFSPSTARWPHTPIIAAERAAGRLNPYLGHLMVPIDPSTIARSKVPTDRVASAAPAARRARRRPWKACWSSTLHLSQRYWPCSYFSTACVPCSRAWLVWVTGLLVRHGPASVSGRVSVFGERVAACVGGSRERDRWAFRHTPSVFPRTAHELAHPHAHPHAARNFPTSPSTTVLEVTTGSTDVADGELSGEDACDDPPNRRDRS